MPVCHDALGTMLLVGEKDDAIRAIARNVNAVADAQAPLVHWEDVLSYVDRGRRQGFLESAAAAGERVLAVRLPTTFGLPAAIGLYAPAEILEHDRAALLAKLNAVAEPVWHLEAADHGAVPPLQMPDCPEAVRRCGPRRESLDHASKLKGLADAYPDAAIGGARGEGMTSTSRDITSRSTENCIRRCGREMPYF